MDLEKEPFLEDDGASGDESSFAHSGKSLRGRLWSIVHIVFITVYTGIFVLSTRGQCALQTSLHPIDNLVVAAASKPYDDFEQSPYAGLPSPSIDAAWHYLLEHTTIRVTPTELNRSNQTSVELPGGGYMAWLGVFHELHCIKMVRQWVYRDHYYPNMTNDEFEEASIHAADKNLRSLLGYLEERNIVPW
ncbi:hypothetical protein GRF29_77g43187 [Pseudopithomyces chartarum]|uniref:Uncharacterized protein n=1 Tax=Pseudopithomyces chartarum TaxID=1892770 RepID=A0AAN6LXY0_9PLEO|nr:hypothetical protein GRF29_77g43187 [Pseudopithomyces chartarum]